MINTILTQPVLKQLTPSMAIVQQGELEVIVIKHATCQAAMALQGAHLLFWQPTEQPRPVIWLSEKAQFKTAKAIRGGVPICWPWFNQLGTPSHGFARISLWQLAQYSETEQGVMLTLTLSDTPQTRQLWPHAFDATMTITLGKQAYLELSMSGDYQATAALHSYFNVSDINQIKVTGLGIDYRDALSVPNPPKQCGELTFDQAVDRLYTNAEAINYIYDIDRMIKLTHHNGSEVVTWNPWQTAATAMADMDDDGYRTMVCVETARIIQPLIVTPTQSQTLAVTIEIEQ
jgi:glucose-6-phosphate 1-epimerase